MQGVALLVVLSALGVESAWRQTEDGQVEYVLQIEPVLLSALAEGKEIVSDLPADVERVDRLCLRISSGSTKSIPKVAPAWPELNPTAEQRAAQTAPPDAPLAVYLKATGDPWESHDLTHGWQPASESESAYLIQIDPSLLKLLAEGDEVYAAVLPDAGVVRQFKITVGNVRLPRKTARPPVVPVTQLQEQAPRSSSPAADVPPVSDFTTGSGSSIYGGGDATDLTAANRAAETGVKGQSPSAMLQPPANQPLDVPQFDRSRFRQSAATGSTTGGAAPRVPAAAAPPPRYAAQQPHNYVEAPEDEPPPRMASRTTGSGRLDQDQLPERRTNLSGAATPPAEKEPEFPALPFTLSLFALFLSIGANLYLGWTAAEFYSRYRLAIERLRSAGRS